MLVQVVGLRGCYDERASSYHSVGHPGTHARNEEYFSNPKPKESMRLIPPIMSISPIAATDLYGIRLHLNT